MKKGISPLIAAVILIAFVIAVAGIASTFFTGFVKEKKSQISQKGGKTIDCSVAVLELDPEMVSPSGTTVSVALENNGKTDISNLRATTYNTTSVVSDSSPQPSNISKGTTEYINITPAVSSDDLYKIRVTTTDCPGLESVINKTGGTWKVIS